jgi:hypothetical protein
MMGRPQIGSASIPDVQPMSLVAIGAAPFAAALKHPPK